MDKLKNGRQKSSTEALVNRATFVGRDSCLNCHKAEYNLWKGSDHDLAMQEVNEETVLGDFNNATITHFGITSKFFKRDGKFYVNTEGPDGKFNDFEIAYVFGITPLQQYLVKFPRGRFQVLPLCWDTRPEEEGGQRWFHIYPDERIAPDDLLYWTRMNQNWNFMCAECHSTNLKKNFNPVIGAYNTTWSEIDVSCEACHGPGSLHVEWADKKAGEETLDGYVNKGLTVQVGNPGKGVWIFSDTSTTAKRTTPLRSKMQIETCARCHSRRGVISENYIYGRPLLDTHDLQLLEENMYFPDGQIQDEVYVYGSFLQSKMYRRGVVCSDCHEPHSTRILAQGNLVCYRCHKEESYNTLAHHFHNPEKPGASCADCHMPERTYMVVDPRRDHSIRIPRPDLSLELGTPNACNQCHADKPVKWASDNFKKWYGNKLPAGKHYGEIIQAGREGHPQAEKLLTELVSDTTIPAIVRASALLLLRNYPGKAMVKTLQQSAKEKDDIVRYGVAGALDFLNPEIRLAIEGDLLKDSIRAVRVETAGNLAGLENRMSAAERTAFNNALSEYIEAQKINADRPSAHLKMARLYIQSEKFDEAEAEYRQAIKIEPHFIYSYINLADLYRSQNRDKEGEQILLKALEKIPRQPEIHYAYGLLLVREKRANEAIEQFKIANDLHPGDAQISYVYGIALNSIGETTEAIAVLEKAYENNPYNRDLLYALITINRDRGNLDAAIGYTEKMLELAPDNRNFLKLLQDLKLKRKGS
ncbi:MAG: tetratricopeptide repeat protein [Calditrichia bacterium]